LSDAGLKQERSKKAFRNHRHDALLRIEELPEETMAETKWLAEGARPPAGPKFVLIEYGGSNGLHRHAHGLTFSVDRNASPNLLEAHIETVLSEAQALADFEKIDTVYVSIPKRTKNS
jgi:hypothetical protein